MALRLTVPTAQPVLLPVSNAGATPGGCNGGDQGFQLDKRGGHFAISVRARPRRSSALSVFHCESVLHGVGRLTAQDGGFRRGQFWARSSVAGMSLAVLSGAWSGHNSNYTGTARARSHCRSLT
jgi:hypothetical protein